MNIVLLDDELVALEFLKRRVATIDGVTAVAFSRPTPALDWCAMNDADVVIVDYMMPEIDGISFAKRVRELPGKADIPVLMITAASDTVVREHALAEGINDFVTKPVNPVELSARVGEMIALRSSQKLQD
jgi:putative two-component system response regulator